MLSTLILVGLQLSWFVQASKIKADQFNENVHFSLSTIVRKLESTDARNSFEHHYKRQLEKFIQQDPIAAQQTLGFLGNSIERTSNYAASDERLYQIIEECTPILKEEKQLDPVNLKVGDGAIQISETEYVYDNNGDGHAYSKNIYIGMEELRRFADDFIIQMVEGVPNLEYRLKLLDLDSLIENELKIKGINKKYEFAVADRYNNTVMESDNFDIKGGDQYYQAQLFPSNIFSESNFLTIYFPGNQEIGFHSPGGASLSSFALILLIVSLFGYTIHRLQRQKQLSLMKTDFINNMTHELKTPISTISLASEMLNNEGLSQDRVTKYAGIIHKENRRLGDQVERVLQIAKLDKGQHKLNPEVISLNQIIKETVEHFLIKIEQKKGSLTVEGGAMNHMVNVDRFHISQIISNLVDNAIKYSKQAPEIILKTKNEANGVLFSVKDNGIGMKREELKRIFDKFYRVPTGNIHDVKGFGLGLNYVKSMVDAHGGYITAESEPGKGSTFFIYLPFNHFNLN